MSAPSLLATVLLLVVAAYLVEVALDWLNQRQAAAPLPKAADGLYEPQALQKAIDYQRENFRVRSVENFLSVSVLVAALASGWFGALDGWLRGFTSQPILLGLAFFAVLASISALISLPFDVYRTFSVEQRFGFNQTDLRTFITDRIKGALLGAMIAAPLLAALIWLHEFLGMTFIIVAWVLLTLFSLVMFAFGTSVIVPLFNKLTPLPEGELRDELLNYCQGQGYEVGRLFVMDGSKRSSKANAFFAGLGRSKTIVLFDTLIEKLSTQEVVSVLAHEVGHYKRKHTLGMFALSAIQTLVLVTLLGVALEQPVMSQALGADLSSFHVGALAFFILLTPMNLIVDLGVNAYSRHNEFVADQFSVSTYPGEHLASGLRKISVDSLANLNPHPWYVAVNYTHPPLVQRLAALD